MSDEREKAGVGETEDGDNDVEAHKSALNKTSVDKAGVGSAVLNSGRQVGGSLGIAVMGAIVAASATGVPGTPEAVEGFVTGYQHALQVAAAIALAGAILSVATIRKFRHEAEPVFEGA